VRNWMKKRSPSYGQNGQLVHWWLLVHSGPLLVLKIMLPKLKIKKKRSKCSEKVSKSFFFFPKIWWICFFGKKKGISRENIPFNYYLRKFSGNLGNFFNSHLFWLNSHPFFARSIICRLNLSVFAPPPWCLDGLGWWGRRLYAD